MTTDIILYRIWRLRRLIPVAILPPLAVTAMSLSPGHPLFGPFVILSITLPFAHLLIYPKDWTETMTVSVVLSILIWLGSGIDPASGSLSVFLRVMGLVALGPLLFLVLILPMGILLALGPMRERSQVRATRRSRLAPHDLKASITLYPGRDDARTTCGESNADGIFDVVVRHEFAGLGNTCSQRDDVDEVNQFDEDGNVSVRFHASVVSTGADHHEIVTFEDPDGPVEAARHSFETDGDGSRVTVEETTAGLTLGMAAGFWLQDYLADHLTDEVDAAEGREPRANRAFPHTSLLTDMVRWLSRRRGAENEPQTNKT